MLCPNCANEVNYTNFCTNCGIQLVYINEVAYNKRQYDEIKNLHDQLDFFIQNTSQTEDELKQDLNNESIYIELENDQTRRKSILKDMDNAQNNLTETKDTILDINNNPEKLDYVKSMNHVFGDIEAKMDTCLNLIDKSMIIIDEFKVKINKSTSSINNTSNTDISQFHSQLDEMLNNLDNTYASFSDLLENDAYNQLRGNMEERRQLKNTINESRADIRNYQQDLRKKLNNKKEMKKLHELDYKYGNVEEKMKKCIDTIDITLDLVDKIDKMINSIENPPQDSNIKLNQKRILDL